MNIESIKKDLTSLGGIRFLELLFLKRKNQAVENKLFFESAKFKPTHIPYNYLLFLGLYAINSPGKKDNDFLFEKIIKEVPKILENFNICTVEEYSNINENSFWDIIKKEFQFFQIFSMDKYNVEYVKNCCEKLITEYCISNTEKKFLLKLLNYISRNEELTVITNPEKNFFSKLNNKNFIKIKEKFLKNLKKEEIQLPNNLNFSIINLNVLIQNSNKNIIILPNYLSIYLFYLNLLEYLKLHNPTISKKAGKIIENELLSYIKKHTNLPCQSNFRIVDHNNKEYECDLIMESEKFSLIFEIKKSEFSHETLKNNSDFFSYDNFFSTIYKITKQLLIMKEILTNFHNFYSIKDFDKFISDPSKTLKNIKNTTNLKNPNKIVLTYGITFGDFKFLGKRRLVKNIIKLTTPKMLHEAKVCETKINKFESFKNSLGPYMEDFIDLGFIDIYTFLKLCETSKTVDELGETLFSLAYLEYHAQNNITNLLALQQDKDKPTFEELKLDLEKKYKQGIRDIIHDGSTVYQITNKK